MSKIKFYFILLIATVVSISSCNKDDNNDVVVTPPKPFGEQYALDIVAIEDYLKTNYISEIVNNPGFPNDQDVTMKKITDTASQPSLWSYLNSPTLPRLTSRNVSLHGITYKVYTLVIREGVKGGSPVAGGEYPCNVDAVFAGNKGTLLDGTVFYSSNNGQVQYNLDGTSHDGGTGVIRGWSEGFPQFKTGWLSSKNDGVVVYNDFGVGVMFLPSGMGYYNDVKTGIPAYSPLVFSIKLYALKRFDHDADGIPSFQEDLDGDRYMNSFLKGVSNPDDTDKDEIPDFLDFDDDGDNYATRGEVKDANGKYYEFDKIPDCSGNQTEPTRKKRHLDATCIKMNQ
ncbi:FKBP-type peptidyl-prolyl cis-trans isomerase [Flavobacterium laiguense]|uniref:peptidylprolyl isomerase n=1 Tax=Flavobacterium laiguense TaxID=2169409 RepID=A0A2U1JMG2_9FLAO|nr:FKBP-type peptidylprolyl isomerase [Flavobacterium laiguense]PWA06048.1 FKBP-type peptidylprolyl isomerase [Flavobacterium laiguense]